MLEFDDLPPQIVPALQAFGQALAQHISAQRGAALEAHEQGVLDAWRAAAPAVLTGTLQATTPGLDPAARPLREACPTCAARHGHRDRRARTLLTRLGAVTVERPWYHCPRCRHGWSPADQALALAPQQRTSAGVQRWEAALGAVTIFAEAQTLLADLAGVEVGEETLRTHAEQVGAQVEAAQQAAIAHVQTHQAPPPGTADPAPAQLVVQTDGVMVRYRDVGFQEVKLGLVAGCTPGNGRPPRHPQHRAPELQAPSYVAAHEAAEAFGPRLLAEAARRGALEVVDWEQPPGVDPRLAGVCGPALAVLRSVQVLGDGAVWIWHLSAAHFGAERIEVVDWYHASEHLWTLGRALHGEGTAAAAAWVEQAAHRLWQHGPAPLLALLQDTAAPTAEAAAVLRRERGYFTTNAHRMQYPLFRKLGLPIGSGAIEAEAKRLVQLRLKRPGMRWSEPGATNILSLRAHLLSGRSLPPHHLPTKVG